MVNQMNTFPSCDMNYRDLKLISGKKNLYEDLRKAVISIKQIFIGISLG